MQSGSPTALKKMAVGEPDRVVWSFGNHVTAFVSAIGHLSCKESFLSNSFCLSGGQEWGGPSTRGAEKGGGQSDLARRDFEVNLMDINGES